ncbi:MAG: epoxyqueuosine reductase [Negativicutes bacterium]|nr:epoxyqueuosine reductase [Negativicutes bacterium]
MKQLLIDEIRRFVAENPANRFPDCDRPYFDQPLVGFASADDPLFAQYKTIIGDFHLTPQELVNSSPEQGNWKPVTVISWVLPITKATRMTNRGETVYPSLQWAQTRGFGEKFNDALRLHVVEFLISHGYHAAAPQLLPIWQRQCDTPVGIASTFSERHAAYAAGLGTFSLSDAMITPKGIAQRLGSVITDLEMEPSPRIYPNHRANCLYYREQTCGACIKRCPAGAISAAGHDKDKCCAYVHGTVKKAVGPTYGVPITGCGLCQTRVPCEEGIPVGREPYP